MPLLVSSSTNNVSTGAASPVPVPAAAAAAAEHSDGLLFDGLVLGHGDDVNNKAKADNDDDDAPTEKLEWLRSQIIGSEAEFASPFGTRRITYADHTASGRCLRFVEEFVARNVLPFYGNTHTTDSYVGLHTSKMAGDAARYVKRSLGAGPQDMLLFCGTGCTAAIKRLQEVTGMAVPPTLRAAVLAALPPTDRWVVFVGPYEHHSNLLSWRESLAEVVEIGLRVDGVLDLAALEAELAARAPSGRPMLGAFSACSNVTGLRTDTRAVAAVLHRHGAYACFDFACSAPYVRVDMRPSSGDVGDADDDGYDAVFLSAHKFLGGPGSPGVLAMASRLYRLRGTAPSTCGGGTVHYVSAYGDTVYCEDAEEREDAGTPAIIQKVRAALAFRVKEWVGEACIEAQEARMLTLALRRARTEANPNLRLLQGADDDAASAPRRLPVLSFVVYAPRDATEPPEAEGGGWGSRPQLHCRFVTKLLNDLFGVQARAGCACAGPYAHRLLGISPARAKAIRSAVEQGYHGVRPGWTRVSLAYYTSTQEAEFVLDAVAFVASFGHRFLPLYAFDWKTGDWHYDHRHGHGCARGLVPNHVVGNPGGRVKAENGYQSYMAFAHCLAESLATSTTCSGLTSTRAKRIPKSVDPQLVYFLV
ncbi:uncharacterized protein LOC8069826 [Sorghum bicolor]|uniref:Aminotransferase class V domain-containing protein n=1 Tax=Sorghum bicolor TaxID=4558 RepID=C5XJ08_SORBI|nr:uncharacterized protein LOC8069826 [Sorghum bicolor]EES03557.1 hypothetical protein SORBI_3003G284200 [Sorghum bicolor]|eukprot:XP_002458437.1 uncharacterized protein LOC8069826 [Sorghum bicolor]